MKNLKKIVLGLMILLAAFAFVGCPTPEQPAPTPDPEPTPVAPVNNFKGNVYVMSYEEEEEGLSFSWIIGYIEFTDDTNGKVVKLSNSGYDLYTENFTYTVEDGVATITGTNTRESLPTLTTSKLENDIFTIDVDEDVFTCKKGDKSLFVKGYAYLGDSSQFEEEMYLATLVNELQLVEEDYIIKDGNLVLTKAYQEKNDVWIVIIPNEESEAVEYEYIEELFEFIGLQEGEDYIVDEENYTITITDAGYEKMMAAAGEEWWYFMDPEGNILDEDNLYFSSLEEALVYASFLELVEVEDYTIDEENQVIILTDSGMLKIEAMMGGAE